MKVFFFGGGGGIGRTKLRGGSRNVSNKEKKKQYFLIFLKYAAPGMLSFMESDAATNWHSCSVFNKKCSFLRGVTNDCI